MDTQKPNLDVFRELELRALTSRSSIRAELLEQKSPEWRHDAERERGVREAGLNREDVLVFSREEVGDTDAAYLILWQWEAGGSFKVTNILPKSRAALSMDQYNEVMADFVAKIAQPAAEHGSFVVMMSSPTEELEKWLSPAAVQRLLTFARTANRSTGSTHPVDQATWFDFVIQAHSTGSTLKPDALERWLINSERWPTDTAHSLANEYEYAVDLLRYRDRTM